MTMFQHNNIYLFVDIGHNINTPHVSIDDSCMSYIFMSIANAVCLILFTWPTFEPQTVTCLKFELYVFYSKDACAIQIENQTNSQYA